MRVRALSASGDYTFGQGSANFLINSAAAVAQMIQTRLLLIQGEWFLDLTAGTPYATDVLGKGTGPLYDQAIKTRILGTQGVTQILEYESALEDRVLTITALVDTIYGPVPITTPLTVGTTS